MGWENGGVDLPHALGRTSDRQASAAGVEPDARGVGVGRQLVEACIARARTAGYRQLELWTDSQLTSARRLYARAGFKLRDTKVERHFGQDIGSETWAMAL